jgi:hypothetical protein
MRHKLHSLLYNRCSVHFSIRSMIGLGQLHRHQSYTSFSTAQTGPSIKRRSVLRVILCCDLQCCNPRECLGTRFRQVHRAIIKPDACYETTSLLLALPPPHTTRYTPHAPPQLDMDPGSSSHSSGHHTYGQYENEGYVYAEGQWQPAGTQADFFSASHQQYQPQLGI